MQAHSMYGKGRQLATICAACALLGGCATETPVYQSAIQAPAATAAPAQVIALPAPPTPLPQTAATTITPLDYYAWAIAATPQELTAERLRLTARRGSANPVVDTVHLGILMSLSELASRESEQAAMALLSAIDAPMNIDEHSHEYALFADFLLNHLQQREDLRAATSNVVESREALEVLERSNRQLQEKIEALTSIEEQLIEREQAEVQAEAQAEAQADAQGQAQGQTSGAQR